MEKTGDLIFKCGYCLGQHKGGGRKAKGVRGRKNDGLPYGSLRTWEDLIDHLVNRHRFQIINNKLARTA